MGHFQHDQPVTLVMCAHHADQEVLSKVSSEQQKM